MTSLIFVIFDFFSLQRRRLPDTVNRQRFPSRALVYDVIKFCYSLFFSLQRRRLPDTVNRQRFPSRPDLKQSRF